MRFGISIVPTDYAIPIAGLAQALDARGFDSLWVSTHTHIHSEFPVGKG
jgi:alkanesulfonate monooxygenase SsuD/methylene tetrahydromethanopterin reductase-like flavin-dependent oxidoreductase (luciferase family)